ncbi:Hsp20/alpha crystallin family protein [Desulfurispirillum indicum]|uniref:Heat shock protein Hsp20 n=1 Tax=Desulfurispirillum indicum (strain ATCC BAA-1389 / DSM 22839 / S5) TaxID=653733 RepID=E6W5N7_DESIS|nr:Hsp20/alpha crystallin family protein [Desulfurispirillum indicum]ADU66068.1 heat shock protein Hsp20 [Desulfurispirillum indicum S5]UCZ55476.1 Hsp20/alpha crystallin family protein [Desulfurispirillum indicum]
MRYVDIFDEMDNLMRGFGNLTPMAVPASRRSGSPHGYPALNIWEDSNSFHVDVACPGVRKEDIDISVNQNMLTLEFERKQLQGDSLEYSRIESRYGKFKRNVALKADVEIDAIAASYEDGILSIAIPKAAHAKPRKIEISA